MPILTKTSFKKGFRGNSKKIQLWPLLATNSLDSGLRIIFVILKIKLLDTLASYVPILSLSQSLTHTECLRK